MCPVQACTFLASSASLPPIYRHTSASSSSGTTMSIFIDVTYARFFPAFSAA
ncbi:hypothetical protein JXL21_11665 [Candidatus Bathyarchaeota archaeon]|nr:hypothetical protein [Candidatus Bathyarchaeota archaeon]